MMPLPALFVPSVPPDTTVPSTTTTTTTSTTLFVADGPLTDYQQGMGVAGMLLLFSVALVSGRLLFRGRLGGD